MSIKFLISVLSGNQLTDDQILGLLGEGNFSDIEDSGEDDDEIEPSIHMLGLEPEVEPEPEPAPEPAPEPDPEPDPEPQPAPPVSTSSARPRVTRPVPRKRVWKKVPFIDLSHDYSPLPVSPVRTPMEYFTQYFDREFLKEVSRCTNMYHLRKTGRELKTTAVVIARLFSIQIVMGCIQYPRVPMYWRVGYRLDIICKQMSRDQFILIRNALHVVDTDEAPVNEKNNPLWKVQPMINKVKMACMKLERVRGHYSVDEQMIPFMGRCSLRQVVKNKPRPVGLKNFVLTTSEGLMLDFEIYKGAKTTFGDTSLGQGTSVILHLTRTVPPGSCIYHDRYFTTVPLIEEMHKRKLHSTGTIMINRIPDRAAVKFKTDSAMVKVSITCANRL